MYVTLHVPYHVSFCGYSVGCTRKYSDHLTITQAILSENRRILIVSSFFEILN